MRAGGTGVRFCSHVLTSGIFQVRGTFRGHRLCALTTMADPHDFEGFSSADPVLEYPGPMLCRRCFVG